MLSSRGLPGILQPPCPCQELQLELSWESAWKRKESCPLGRRGNGSSPSKQLT